MFVILCGAPCRKESKHGPSIRCQLKCPERSDLVIPSYKNALSILNYVLVLIQNSPFQKQDELFTSHSWKVHLMVVILVIIWRLPVGLIPVLVLQVRADTPRRYPSHSRICGNTCTPRPPVTRSDGPSHLLVVRSISKPLLEAGAPHLRNAMKESDLE